MAVHQSHGNFMKLWIEIKDGSPINHPYTQQSLFTKHPDWDFINKGVPPQYEEFKRVRRPSHGPFEYVDEDKGVEYKKVDDLWQDVWTLKQFTPEQKALRQQQAKDWWNKNVGWDSWIFNADKNEYEPPKPYPNTAIHHVWDESKVEWVPGLLQDGPI